MNKNKDPKKGKEFFELIENLDEDIVEDAWSEKSGRVTIVEARTPLGIIRDIAAAAACIAVLAAGVYGVVQLNNINVTPGESGTSYNESLGTESSDSTGSDTGSSVTSKIQPDSPNSIGFSEMNRAEKLDNENYAVVYINETNATEVFPMYITVYSFLDNLIEDRPVSELVKVTGPGEYTLRYTGLRGAGSINSLRIEAGIEWENSEIIPSLNGTWIP